VGQRQPICGSIHAAIVLFEKFGESQFYSAQERAVFRNSFVNLM
jgi:hypothetical protein